MSSQIIAAHYAASWRELRDNALEHARAKPDQSKLMIAEMLRGGGLRDGAK